MMVRRCDRCGAFADQTILAGRWWTRITPPPHPPGANTPDDADLCPACTASFRSWWNRSLEWTVGP